MTLLRSRTFYSLYMLMAINQPYFNMQSACSRYHQSLSNWLILFILHIHSRCCSLTIRIPTWSPPTARLSNAFFHHPMPTVSNIYFYQSHLSKHSTSTSTHHSTTPKKLSTTHNTTTINISNTSSTNLSIYNNNRFFIHLCWITRYHSILLTPLLYVFLYDHRTDSSPDYPYYSSTPWPRILPLTKIT